MNETDQTINLNHNAAECIHSTMNWGETVYLNVCSGVRVAMPWGSLDYIGAVFLVILAAAGVTLVVGMLIVMLRLR